MKLFLQKNAKFSSAGGSAPRPPCLRRLGALPPNPQPPAAGGFAPRPPLASGGWGLRSQTPQIAPPLRISGYAPDYVCAKFQGNESRVLGFRTGKPPQKFGEESSLIQKRLKYGKKTFHMVICRKIPFHPSLHFRLLTLLSFFFFCFLNLVRSSSPKPLNIKI